MHMCSHLTKGIGFMWIYSLSAARSIVALLVNRSPLRFSLAGHIRFQTAFTQLSDHSQPFLSWILGVTWAAALCTQEEERVCPGAKLLLRTHFLRTSHFPSSSWYCKNSGSPLHPRYCLKEGGLI